VSTDTKRGWRPGTFTLTVNLTPLRFADRQGYRHLSVSVQCDSLDRLQVLTFLPPVGQLRQANSPLGRPLWHQEAKARDRRRVRRLELARKVPAVGQPP
jgi:hypothetical protein